MNIKETKRIRLSSWYDINFVLLAPTIMQKLLFICPINPDDFLK